MRYICTENCQPDEKWLKKAERLTEELRRAPDKEARSEIIKNNQRVWSEIKDWLLSLSSGKCWYSEAREIYSFYDVDHFRPKNAAKQLNGEVRDGYWWLAFNWKNYRVVGAIGNRLNRDINGETRGKSDYFPVKEGSNPACSELHDLDDELAYFLDPTQPDDPLLITFDETGKPKPAAEKGTWEYERADKTIWFFHLDYRPLVDERKRVWGQCRLLLNKAQVFMERQNAGVSVSDKARLKEVINDLRDMVKANAELSATARACLLSSGLPWAQRIAAGE